MKRMIQWAVHNSPAMNTLMIGLLGLGVFSMVSLRREVFPQFELEVLLVSVPYPGASPEEAERGICQKIEEAVFAIDGITKPFSVAKEGVGFLILELDTRSDPQRVLSEVRSAIDAIPSFPELAEKPEVKQITFRLPAIKVAVIGEETDDPFAEQRLRQVTEQVRSEIIQLPAVSQARIDGSRNYQIDVEISEDALKKYNLTLQGVADVLRDQNVEIPGGSVKGSTEEVLLRAKNKGLTGDHIARLPLLETKNGSILTVEDLAVVRDAFEDNPVVSSVNGQPGLVVSVERTRSEDLLSLAKDVRNYVSQTHIPGYRLQYFSDQSIDVADRIEMLLRNGIQGLLLVFLVLAVFLDLRLAFWVALGIPIAVLGAGSVLLIQDQTLNMLSLFAFLMALGIVVDDAIVIGENIYEHRQMGKPFAKAAVEGTFEVMPAVSASVTTTIIAFLPLMFVSGVMGKFIAVMPMAVIAMLVISLIEAAFILPCHLGHQNNALFRFIGVIFFPLRFLARGIHALHVIVERQLLWFIHGPYQRFLKASLNRTPIVFSTAIGMLMIAYGFKAAGIVPWVLFPKIDSRTIEARVVYPDGTPMAVTQQTAIAIEAAILECTAELQTGDTPLIHTRRQVVGKVPGTDDPAGAGGGVSGSHLGMVEIELIPVDQRSITSDTILTAWREAWNKSYADQFPGIESLTFRAQEVGPGGKPIEFKLLAPATKQGMQQLEAATEACKLKLATYQGLTDIDDDSRPGKLEFQFTLRENARVVGVTVGELARTVRAAFYGAEVMRLQRGRHEVKLMVRYPRDERRAISSINEIRIKTKDGKEYPLAELADVQIERGYSEINRMEQMRSITVVSDITSGEANAAQVTGDLQREFMPQLLETHPLVNVRWEGQQEQSRESMSSMMIGLGVAVIAMFALLTIQFRSHLQPLIILGIIPFGFVGAAVGHAAMGLEFTLFSVFGMIALTGVVVNDSIVLIDFINRALANGSNLREALVQAGLRRFRPVVLTSMTTIAGLTPIMLEHSHQAQVLVPMAVSLCFGLAFATILILLLVPAFYQVYYRFVEKTTGRPPSPRYAD